jgi:hypothetical protein
VAREDLEDGLETEPGFLDLLRRDDEGACIYLDEDGRCSVWERRPFDCRLFTCEGRQCPAVLRPRGAGPLEPDVDPPPAETDCAHCGERAGFVAHFLPVAWRIRCAACGGPFLPRVVHGMRPRLRVDPGPRSPARRLVDRGEVREFLGDFPGALEDLRAAALLAPGDVDHALIRLRVAAAAGEDGEAERAFEAARDFDEARAWLGRGFALDARGEAEEAERALRRAEALGARSIGLAWALARTARERGEVDEAVVLLERAAEGGDARVLQDLVDLAVAGVPGAEEAIVRTDDRRAMGAIGRARPWLGA